jgi:NADPH:quinone reductase-like Zn-dependent oxidoreductase
MQAIRIHQYGDRSVLRCEKTPDPAPGRDDVLVRVRAAGVNPADCQFVAATTRPWRR